MDICNEKLLSTCNENFLGIKIDNKLTLEEHVEGLCKKASQKVIAVARILSLKRFEQRKRIVNLSATSHFSHNPLVWMFHSRRINNRIDHIHEAIFKTQIRRMQTRIRRIPRTQWIRQTRWIRRTRRIRRIRQTQRIQRIQRIWRIQTKTFLQTLFLKI